MIFLAIKNKDILKVIGTRIKEARNNKNFTQEYVAEKIDKSPDIIRNIENGRSVGSVETLLNICNLLDITLDDVFYELLENKNSILDEKIYKNFQDLSLKEKEMINMLISYLKSNR